MKNRKINSSYLLILSFFALALTASCTKWLDVKPEDKFTKEQMYQSKQSVQELVNGFYLNLGNTNLYGGNLTLTALDAIAQRYQIMSSDSYYYPFVYRNYSQASVDATISTIWGQMYLTLANINDFVLILPTVNNGLTQEEKNLFLGEAIGLRAFIHFDLLRMFGKPYDETSKSEEAIPYYRNLSTNIEDFISSEQVVVNILEDIAEAEKLLENDPITSQSGTTNNNNNRFNLYAVKALKARVYQWIGDKPMAAQTAKEVIAVQSKFPWVTHAAATTINNDTDRKFFTEIIFGAFNPKLYDVYRDNFDGNLLPSSVLSTGSGEFVDKVYESYEADYRYKPSWSVGNSGITFKTFTKYSDLANKENKSRFIVPVIRISEMYYIVAESTEDSDEALQYLNTVRQKRNIINDVTDPTRLQTELTKEYQKEFYGEGQLWYYYKRNKMTSIPSMNSNWSNITISLNDYVFPIPITEKNGR